MKARAARIAAQAKINLHLRVLAREESGYHSIETIFHRIDLADDILVETTSGKRSIEVTGAETGPPEFNLAYRAAAAYAEQAGWLKGFHIVIDKKIPVGAGLGGGSADAAGVLRILDFLSPQPSGENVLMAIGSSLGADVPFLSGSAVMAFAWGHGERMMAFPPLPRCDVLLMSPEFGVSTVNAYRWLDEDRAAVISPKLETVAQVARAESVPFRIDTWELSTWAGISKFARNDFEPVVAARHPELVRYLERLRNSRAVFSAMTGSGSTVFGILDSPPDYSKVPQEHRERVTTTKTSIDVVQPQRVG
ncbi:MAG TPA: 4-(cytidine 5'-diphospho)-2-C-methyl-D-erythritol kinase [Gemmatimonadaceae bacterium]|nr:4-(cytidine 5'-diphospho)-2-C-methyl-D-erythritol kinase [Gemmatimonadaceae bacterium]